MKSESSCLYNSRIINLYLSLIKRRYNNINIGDLLGYANIRHYEVEDEGHWFTQRQIDLFYERLVQLTGNTNIAREAGRFVASPEGLGNLRQFIMGMTGPASLFRAIQSGAEKLTRSTSYQSRMINDNTVELTVIPREGVEEKPFQCENRMGMLEAVPLSYNRIPRIEHTECIFQGGKACRYIVSWESSRVEIWKKRLRGFVPLSLAGCIAAFLFTSPATAALVSLSIMLLVMCLFFCISEMNRKELLESLSNFLDQNEQVHNQINQIYNSALMSAEIGKALDRDKDIKTILSNIMETLENRLSFDRGMVFLDDERKERLEFQAGFGQSEEHRHLLSGLTFSINKPGSKGIFVKSYKLQLPYLVNDLENLESDLSLRSIRFAKILGVKSFICCPVICEGESVGILAVDNVRTKKPLVQSDLSLVQGVSSIIGASISIARHIEQEKLITEQLWNAQKLEVVGRLAGSIAHDFNNILTAVTGYAEVIQMKSGEKSDLDREITGINKSVDRASSLIQQLLAYSRRQVLKETELDVNSVINGIEDILRHLAGKSIGIMINLDDNPHKVQADPGQIEQVLLNLIANARDAMPEGGKITIETKNILLDADYRNQYECIGAGAYSVISVADTGSGMGAETRKRMFEPFFTTKEVGKGTGLGLASAYGIIHQHNGHIDVSSAPGEGTTIRIFLPVVEGLAGKDSREFIS